MDLKECIRLIPNYPKEGILFKDITPLLKNSDALQYTIKQMVKFCENKQPDIVVGPESRGFIFGTPLAYELGAGFVPVRKPGKLPAEVERVEYELEYGTDALEIHKDSIMPGQKVVICDDLLATGGTVQSAIQLIEKLGGEVVGICFLIELTFLNGADKLKGYDVQSLIKY
ncbi:adenine phosphoribosyltransferase [Desulfuribacillus stibiiarsenatis]|uniref:Adenine phosphoribosyltransferase n=1 Tax=Desulfuribacillus stibiiarsenatis TaxID=1390249 RepID=A0A1E5L3D5_9FIRM|nr:adenine phosphoribosyltransferase [Desulfuribacillus stibiiarsenatis]OEH84573.1 adenine phosphoribosyltransferase [Desulfuribacillus stibiiarsenatis]